MKSLITTVAALALTVFINRTQAQTYTMNWATSFTPAWATGNITGTANNVGGSGVKLTVQLVKSGGVYTTTYDTYGGPMTPTVSATPYIVGGSSSNIAIALEFTNNTQYMDAIFTFNKPVFNVSFNVGDIDRLTNTLYNYLDQITITGYNGVLSGSPTITKYDAVTDPNFLIISGGKAYVNPVSGMAGNSASDATDQKGTIKVRFGGVYITSFRIRYDNYPGTQADPTVQNITIGNISFNTSIPLPVTISSFDGNANDDGTVGLNWDAQHEYNFDYYAIERSENGVNFSEIGRVESKRLEGASQYRFLDNHATAGKYFYRLRMVDLDGAYNYSRVITISPKKYAAFRVYPTLFQKELTISVYTQKAEKLRFMIFNMIGTKMHSIDYFTTQGTNEIPVNLPGSLPRGQYVLKLENSTRSSMITKY